jgi:DNA-3-methyladenine glycosylase II
MVRQPRSSGAATEPAADIETVLTQADSKLGHLIDAVVARAGILRPSISRASTFEALARAIVYQSVSERAAAVIYGRLQQSKHGLLTPQNALALTQAELRHIGLSAAKALAVHHLAEWFLANSAMAKQLPGLPDEEIIEALTAIPGIGAWTVNVFLIFSLRRLDVMPTADLGIRRGVQLIDGRHDIPTPKEVHERAMRWSPYRSVASMYLWRAGKLKVTADDLARQKHEIEGSVP